MQFKDARYIILDSACFQYQDYRQKEDLIPLKSPKVYGEIYLTNIIIYEICIDRLAAIHRHHDWIGCADKITIPLTKAPSRICNSGQFYMIPEIINRLVGINGNYPITLSVILT